MHRELVGLAVVAVLLFVPWLGARDLWNPNEPTYGQAVVEMAAAGEWLVPTVNGEVFGEKPILYYWMARVAAALFGGVDELTLRLPSAASGVAAVLLLFLLVEPYVGRRRAVVAAALLSTTFIVFWSARQVQMDLLVTTTTLAAVLCATRVVDHGLRPLAGWALAGAAVGLGVLAKGPVGLICPALVVLAYLVATGRAGRIADVSILAGVASFLLVAAPWFWLLWMHGEAELLTEVLIRQNFGRFIDPWDHQAPWWYYLKYFWIDMAPWSLFVPLAWGLRPAGGPEARLERLAWIWIAVLVVFFSLSASKRSPYILPVAPAVAVLVSGVAERWRAATLDDIRRRIALGIHLLLGVGLIFLGQRLWADPGWTQGRGAQIAETVRLIAVIALACGAAVVVAVSLSGRRRIAAPTVLFGAILTLYAVGAARALPAADAAKSRRPFCEAVLRQAGGDAPLRGFHEWRWRAGYSYYTGRVIPNIESLDSLRTYWQQPERVFLIVERGRLEEARKVLGSAEPLVERAVGSNHAYLFSNRPH